MKTKRLLEKEGKRVVVVRLKKPEKFPPPEIEPAHVGDSE